MVDTSSGQYTIFKPEIQHRLLLIRILVFKSDPVGYKVALNVSIGTTESPIAP